MPQIQVFISQPLQDYFKRIGLCHFCFAPKGVGVLAISQQLLNGGCWRIPLKFLSHVATQPSQPYETCVFNSI